MIKRLHKRKADLLEIVGFPEHWRVDSRVRHWLECLRGMGLIDRRSTVLLTVEGVLRAKMSSLNSEWRGNARPTDVLSFENPEPIEKSMVFPLGGIVICTPVLRAQAAEFGNTVAKELDVLLVHGLLHLLGYDHEKSKAGEKKMARVERRLLKSHGNDDAIGLIMRHKRRKKA